MAEEVGYSIIGEEEKKHNDNVIDYHIREEQTKDAFNVENANNQTTTGLANIIPGINANKLIATTSIIGDLGGGEIVEISDYTSISEWQPVVDRVLNGEFVAVSTIFTAYSNNIKLIFIPCYNVVTSPYKIQFNCVRPGGIIRRFTIDCNLSGGTITSISTDYGTQGGTLVGDTTISLSTNTAVGPGVNGTFNTSSITSGGSGWSISGYTATPKPGGYIMTRTIQTNNLYRYIDMMGLTAVHNGTPITIWNEGNGKMTYSGVAAYAFQEGDELRLTYRYTGGSSNSATNGTISFIRFR